MTSSTLNQEIFDLAANHLLIQNEQASDDMMRCLYRSPSGLKCAIGALIANADYDITMESLSIFELFQQPSSLFSNSPLLCRAIEAINTDRDAHKLPYSQIEVAKLLMQLQAIHDTIPPSGWFVSLNALAARFKLSNAVLQAFDK